MALRPSAAAYARVAYAPGAPGQSRRRGRGDAALAQYDAQRRRFRSVGLDPHAACQPQPAAAQVRAGQTGIRGRVAGIPGSSERRGRLRRRTRCRRQSSRRARAPPNNRRQRADTGPRRTNGRPARTARTTRPTRRRNTRWPRRVGGPMLPNPRVSHGCSSTTTTM